MKVPALAVSVSMCLISISACLVAQSLPTSGAPSDLASVQGHPQAAPLILWSQAEQPQRAPIPFNLSRPAGRPRSTDSYAPDFSAQQQRTQVGKIERAGRLYVLRVWSPSANQSALVVQLDDQQKASRFEGRQVRLRGTLDEQTNYVKVDNME
jgi:hypothetical protein